MMSSIIGRLSSIIPQKVYCQSKIALYINQRKQDSAENANFNNWI